MAQINEMILSEINGIPNISSEMKEFLVSVLEFERENIDREHINYKSEIESRVNEILIKSENK